MVEANGPHRLNHLRPGIPFAQPPVGNLRFAPPVLQDALNVETLDATHFGAPCVQFNVR